MGYVNSNREGGLCYRQRGSTDASRRITSSVTGITSSSAAIGYYDFALLVFLLLLIAPGAFKVPGVFYARGAWVISMRHQSA